MTNFEIIELKLKRFISKYYRNQLIKGILLFLTLGLLYFLFTVAVEHFLWLDPTGRTILFFLFVGAQLFLLIKFIGIPLARLLKLFSGIDFRDASTMIGVHFPEVSDKLVNVLQLRRNGGDDELTWASINQKSNELKPIPFSVAIDYRKNQRYLPYLAIPVLIIATLFFTGNNHVIAESAKRVADFNNEYIPPAPFSFEILNSELSTLQKKNFTLKVSVDGQMLPETVQVHFKGQTYFLTQETPGTFIYTFKKPVAPISFYLSANEVLSKNYLLEVDDTPIIKGFQLRMDYPNHTGKKDETIISTGNALVPEGTQVEWELETQATTEVLFTSNQMSQDFEKKGSHFAFAKAISKPMRYSITTSNDKVQNYESLDFKIDVVKDEFPELDLSMKKDSIDDTIMHFKGQVADDYGIKDIRLVYYQDNDAGNKKYWDISTAGGTFDQFLMSFPAAIPLEPGKAYEFFFSVRDNDLVNNFKTTRSDVFTYLKPSLEVVQEQQLSNQKESLSQLEKALQEQKINEQEFRKLTQEQLEKRERSFNDKKKLEQALERREKQEQFMRQQLERLKDNLEKSPQPNDPDKKALEERMEQSAAELKKNEELLKQLQEYQDKLDPEKLKEQLEQSEQKSNQQERNLEQLLELTKRYYVNQKFEQLGDKLAKLSQKQKEQSLKEATENKKEEQDALNQDFEEWEQELQQLEKENNDLQKPLDLEFNPQDADAIKKDQQSASEDLQKQQSQAAQKKQKKASEMMEELAKSMAAQMQQQSMQQMQEDSDMLRQILDNLVLFSQGEEQIMQDMSKLNRLSPNLGKKLSIQKDLETAFGHVDDSLFALASRNPQIGDQINKEVTEIYYNLENALQELADFEMSKGQVSQQFALKGANSLADQLSKTLDAMNNALSQPGLGKPKPGQGSGFQLPTIIEQQKSLSQQGEKKGAQGEKPGQGKKPGSEGSSGSQGKGQSGQQGATGKNGQSGQDGQKPGGSGKGSGQGGKDGQGNSGSDGSGSGDGNGEQENSYRESEAESARIYQIYKKQQELRSQLEDLLRREGLERKFDHITDQMKSVERKLLDQGFNREVQELMLEIQHDLLKLKDAGLEQGEDEQREANTNLRDFNNNSNSKIPDAAKYFNNKEILNRQVLPLQPEFRTKVKEYFKTND